jgi:hypothetical protein
MLFIGQDVVPVKVTRNVAVDDVFKYFTDNRCKGVFKLLKDLNPHKAIGPDCIPSFILKSAADELAPILTQLYQFSLAEGEIPSESFMDGLAKSIKLVCLQLQVIPWNTQS